MTGHLEPTNQTVVNPRAELHQRWADRHGLDVADRLAAAEDFADALAGHLVPENTRDTYDKSWRVWQRFCSAQRLPESEGTRGALVAFAAWMLREGRQAPGPGGVLGYAPSSAGTHLAAVVVRLRECGYPVSRDDAGAAREVLDGIAVQLLKDGERRGRGQAPAADIDGLRRIAAACPNTLAGLRDKALVLDSFHFAARASEPAGLLLGDVALHPRGMRVSVLTGKTARSVREAAIPYANDSVICPVRAWIAWRELLVAEGGAQYEDPSDPAFHSIDRWGHIGGAMSPDAVTAVVTRVAERSGIPIRWTGHSLRSGLATAGREAGKDALVIAAQGGWAPNSRAMMGYMRRADEWDDNASAGLA
ncbi:tyrosine-type recombinase/integrase [Rhodococcus sp. NPDC054953]